MKKSVTAIVLTLFLSSCMNQVDINVTFKKLYNAAIKKSGAIVESFGEQGSLSLEYSDLKEDILANFKPINYYCLSDHSCIYQTRVKLTGNSDEYDYLVKVNSQFQIDTTFGVKGYLLMGSIDPRMDNALFDYYSLLGINSADGKMYVGLGNGIVRLLPNGKIDPSFGNKGIFIMDRTTYNYFPTKIIQSNLDELLILTAIAPGGGSISTGNFGSALISVSQSGNFQSLVDFNNTNLIVYRAYNNSFPFPKDLGEMLIVDNSGTNENYYAYMSSQSLMVKKTNLAGDAVVGFNFPGGGYNTTSSNYRVKKLIEVGNEIYVFLSAPNYETLASKLVVFDKDTGVINASKSKNFTNGAQALVLDDVVKSSDGFVLSLKRCLVVSFSGDCGRANRFVAQVDLSGDISNLVSVATSNGVETDNIGQAQSVLQRRNADFYVLNFSPQFIGPLGESYTKLSVKKFDELINVDNTFGNSGEVVTSLGYTIKLSFVNLTDKILLDNDINSYYLLSYNIGLKKVRKILKLDKNINAVTAFGSAGTIDLPGLLEVNSIELDEVNKLLYLVYTVENGTSKEVYIRRYSMLTGQFDADFGAAGDLFVYNDNSGSSTGYSSYYNKQVIKSSPIFNPLSYVLKNGFVLTLQRSTNRTELRIFKFDFGTEILSSKVLSSADYAATANYSVYEISNASLTKKESLFITGKFNSGGGYFHNEILKLSSADLSVDSSFGTNGLMFINGGTATTSGLISEVNVREVFSVTDDYIYLRTQHQYVETDAGGTTYLKYQLTPGYQRLSYLGVADTAFENAFKQEVDSYRTQFSGGKTNISVGQSAPTSKGTKNLSFLLFSLYADDFQEFIALSSDTAALYSTLNIKTVTFEFEQQDSVKNLISKAFPFLSFMNGEIADESFVLQEMYSFDKGEYVYKVAVSGYGENNQPVFKLFKLYN